MSPRASSIPVFLLAVACVCLGQNQQFPYENMIVMARNLDPTNRLASGLGPKSGLGPISGPGPSSGIGPSKSVGPFGGVGLPSGVGRSSGVGSSSGVGPSSRLGSNSRIGPSSGLDSSAGLGSTSGLGPSSGLDPSSRFGLSNGLGATSRLGPSSGLSQSTGLGSPSNLIESKVGPSSGLGSTSMFGATNMLFPDQIPDPDCPLEIHPDTDTMFIQRDAVGDPKPRNCPPRTYFLRSVCSCVNIPRDTFPECNLRPSGLGSGWYEENVFGMWIQRPCGPGSAFSASTCECSLAI
ncbi:decreased expression in renal and prostate cancer protein-like isoform X1 [Mya arenaria]|uniref:decreased expression in renal and prostate cancer protein-like isoform X1 n=1 Tax=Mya arenaria TaxID=6604 RepID=UPI0022E085A5|nr:decreased expression in renal and prostate cancer protein-like isoform X1 [Mya arenaria]XP_052769128.1 decreased expression in renal and prostate cancer protein-like isoform X1 [Mya arenaria]XP_052769206.1 decreased expression in renal and prostate cancer protein-like isoform X1 [Mya arenaria]XP_052820611.1 decreased expression in renal and prostate cancer protein-like isoform X1 [Mya arenaria]XP_052820612.1 decreased expression in renal and prostate cancer protein-like isoform X1 [Mya arena